jgi:iron complex outermembrane receptor protein
MRTLVAAAVACSIVVSLCQAQSSEASIRKSVNIGAQDLSAALQEFARERQLYLIYDDGDVVNHRTRGAAGQLTQDEVFGALLRNTGLTYRYIDEKTVTIMPVPTAPAVESDEVKRVENGESHYAPKSFWQRLRLAQAGSSDNTGSKDSEDSSEPSEPAEVKLQEVVVTAQKREQNLQDVPVSVSAMTNEQIRRLGVDDYREWATFVAGLTISESSLGSRAGPNAVLRGVSNSSFTQLDVTSSTATTAVMIGEIPVFSVDSRLFDMNRVEVLRGPQGTLYGVAAMGGIIKYVPNYARLDAFDAEWSGGGGLVTDGGTSFDVSAMVNVPLVEDKLAMRVVGFHRTDGGFIDMRIPGLDETGDRAAANANLAIETRKALGQQYVKDVNGGESDGARVTFTFTPTENIEIRPMVLWQRSSLESKTLQDLQDPIDRYTERWSREPWSSEYTIASVETRIGIGSSDLTYVFGNYTNDLGEVTDATLLAYILKPPGRPDGRIPAEAPLSFTSDTNQNTHELRLQGAGLGFLGNTRIDYTVGLFHQKERRDTTFQVVSPRWNDFADHDANAEIFTPGGFLLGGIGTADFTNKAAFADVTLHLTDRLAVGAGIRRFELTKRDYRADFGDGIVGSLFGADNGGDDLTVADSFTLDSTESRDWTPRLTVSYDFTPQKMAYLTVSDGFRVGGSNPGDVDDIEIPECRQLVIDLGLAPALNDGFRSDTVRNYDLGFKALWLDGRLLTNASVFYIDWTDLQQEVQLSQINPSCLGIVRANVGAATNKGFELETVYSPNDGLTFNASVSYVHARLSEEFPGVPGRNGDYLQRVPERQAALGAEYRFPLSAFQRTSAYVRADWRHVDERISGIGRPDTIDPFFIAPAYQTTNFRIGVDGERWSGSFYVNNVFDDRVVYDSTSGFLQGFIREGSVGRPRIIGMNLGWKF